jgi:hypothetical protein
MVDKKFFWKAQSTRKQRAGIEFELWKLASDRDRGNKGDFRKAKKSDPWGIEIGRFYPSRVYNSESRAGVGFLEACGDIGCGRKRIWNSVQESGSDPSEKYWRIAGTGG